MKTIAVAQAVIFWHKRYIKMPKRKIRAIFCLKDKKSPLTLIDKFGGALYNFSTNKY